GIYADEGLRHAVVRRIDVDRGRVRPRKPAIERARAVDIAVVAQFPAGDLRPDGLPDAVMVPQARRATVLVSEDRSRRAPRSTVVRRAYRDAVEDVEVEQTAGDHPRACTVVNEIRGADRNHHRRAPRGADVGRRGDDCPEGADID